MTWQPATATPPRQARYLVRLEADRVTTAAWTKRYGWLDGARRLLGVRQWCEIPTAGWLVEKPL